MIQTTCPNNVSERPNKHTMTEINEIKEFLIKVVITLVVMSECSETLAVACRIQLADLSNNHLKLSVTKILTSRPMLNKQRE